MKPKKTIACVGTGIALGVGAVVGGTYLVSKKLVDAAMDRELPKYMRNKCKDAPTSEYMKAFLEKRNAAEEKLKKTECETVTITSHDGLRLVGHLYVPENPKRIVLAMHGWRSSWARDFGIISGFWQENGCMVLYAEQRGQGNSEGAYMTFGMKERYDCLDWLHFIKERTGSKLPIYLCGVSMGATTVLMAGGLELPGNVRGIIADCGFTSPEDIWRHIVQDDLHMRYGKLRRAFADRVTREKTGMAANECSTIDALRRCRVPVLLIHGTDDGFVPVEMTYANYKACAADKQLLIVPGAQHGMSYIKDENAYRQAVMEFWEDQDSGM